MSHKWSDKIRLLQVTRKCRTLRKCITYCSIRGNKSHTGIIASGKIVNPKLQRSLPSSFPVSLNILEKNHWRTTWRIPNIPEKVHIRVVCLTANIQRALFQSNSFLDGVARCIPEQHEIEEQRESNLFRVIRASNPRIRRGTYVRCGIFMDHGDLSFSRQRINYSSAAEIGKRELGRCWMLDNHCCEQRSAPSLYSEYFTIIRGDITAKSIELKEAHSSGCETARGLKGEDLKESFRAWWSGGERGAKIDTLWWIFILPISRWKYLSCFYLPVQKENSR